VSDTSHDGDDPDGVVPWAVALDEDHLRVWMVEAEDLDREPR
jgi:hypothetical protein